MNQQQQQQQQYGLDAVFTRANECQEDSVGDPDCPMKKLQDEFGVDIAISHFNAWQFLSSTLNSEKDRDIIFRVNTQGAFGVLWLIPIA